MLYICEVPRDRLAMLVDEDTERSHEYGLVLKDPAKIPHGPVMIHQPDDTIFDLVRRQVINYVSIMCLGKQFSCIKVHKVIILIPVTPILVNTSPMEFSLY